MVPQKHTKVEFKGKIRQASRFQDRRYMFKEESWELIFGVSFFPSRKSVFYQPGTKFHDFLS